MPATSSEQRAKRALRAAGLEGPLEPASGQANETWIGKGFVLRVNYRGELGRLAREAAIAYRLPPEARYPGVLHQGSDGEIEWIVVRRAAGHQLGRVWPSLSAGERESATVQLAECLRALHSVSDPSLPADGDIIHDPPPHVLPLGPLLEHLDSTRASVGEAMVGEAKQQVRCMWPAFEDDRGRGLVHGDPHLENMLWADGQLSALLDLEWARRSWIQVDLEILLSYCAHPQLFVDAGYEHLVRAQDYAEMPRVLAREYPELFNHPRLVDRVVLLSLSREFGHLVDCPGSPVRLDHIRALLDGTSHLHQLGLP